MSTRALRVAVANSSHAPAPFASGRDHMLAELEWLRLVLQHEILRLKAANLLSADPFRGLYLSDEQVDATLHEWATQSPGERRVYPQPELAEIDESIDAAQHAIDLRMRATFAAESILPMPRLAALFHLSQFECKVLVAAAAVEVDLRFETLYSWARNDVTRRRPSIDLILKMLCNDRVEEMQALDFFSDHLALVRNQLIRLGDDSQERDASSLARSVRADDRIVRFLLDGEEIDKRLQPFTRISQPSRDYNSLYLPDRLRAELQTAATLSGHSIIHLNGPHGSGKTAAVEALCTSAGRALLAADLQQAINSGLAPAHLLLLLQREALLQNADLLLQHAEVLSGEGVPHDQFRAAVERMLPLGKIRIFIEGDTPWPAAAQARATTWHSFDFPIPSFAHRASLWRDALALAGCPLASDVDIELLSNRFALTGGAIREACVDAARRLKLRNTPGAASSLKDLESAARAQSTHGLRRFAQKVVTRGGWSALVLPAHIVRQLRDVCTAERYRHMVYTQWGFDQRLSAGKGLNVLFCGVSGTGKTMAAGILAQELSLDLYRVDLSVVVSKYIGETEKQLSQIFREAQCSNAVLLFDEADALFGKRSEVKDAHDRYANVEVAYLLQKMEEYEGIVILATNLRRNMDEAFTRRMHHIIEFPFPDAEHRERIWRGIIPEEAPVAADVDFNFLARQFEFSGGNIRNVALAAAFLAAEQGTAIRMEHCVIATALEMQKTGKLPSRSEFRDYYDLIRTRT